MADQEGGSTVYQLLKFCVKMVFRIDVHRTRWFIEDDEWRLAYKCASQHQFLPFAEAQFLPIPEPAAEGGIVAVGEFSDERIGIGFDGCLPDFF